MQYYGLRTGKRYLERAELRDELPELDGGQPEVWHCSPLGSTNSGFQWNQQCYTRNMNTPNAQYSQTCQ